MRGVFRFVLVQNQLLLVMTGLLLYLPASAFGQATSGVTGVVTDASGAVIVGAEVRLENSETAFSATTMTNREGEYQFLHVAPGEHYRLTVTKDQLPDGDSFRSWESESASLKQET